MNEAQLNSILVLVFGAVLTWISTRFWTQRNEALAKAAVLAVEHDKVLARLYDLEKKAAVVDAAIVPLNTLYQSVLIRELTHAHTPEMDALLVKVGPPNVLTEPEQKRLTVMLQNRYSETDLLVSDSERDAAFILPAVMKRARAEMQVLDDAEALKLKLVTVATIVGVSSKEEKS